MREAREGGRVIIIAPTRAACETIELGFTLDLETVLWKSRGGQLLDLALKRRPFGIVAGTGTGKTLAVKPIAKAILGTDELRVGVINREREATPDSPTWNVVIVTTGIARRWFQDNDIRPQDILVIDEIHQTSAELELCLALGKRVGCRFIWLSATVDPSFYAKYLNAAEVVESTAFDPAKAADVKVLHRHPVDFLDDRFLQQVIKERRGVGVFLPTRAGVEQIAASVAQRFPRLNVAFYHGGEPIRVIRPFLEEESKPFVLAMTAAGQSALNVRGLDTVIIDDTRFSNLVERGRNVLTKLHLGANEILQMAGRVHGRVERGRVFILSDRDLDFKSLRATAPEFQLAGDSERVALTCAALGVRADALELPVPLDTQSYRQSLSFLESRGIVRDGRLSDYGRKVEAMPVDRPWAELLVHCDDDLLPYVAVMACIESLHRMTREERDLEGLMVRGSDHLTAYALYADAYNRAGSVSEVYGLPRHLFDEERITRWSERRGVLVKAIEDGALGMASVYRAVGYALPSVMPRVTGEIDRAWKALLAQVMPFDLVLDERTVTGDEARVSKTSVCGSWGAVAGSLRYFSDKFGVARAAIEGTQLSPDLIRQYSVEHAPTLVFDPQHRYAPLALERRRTYFGFELEHEREPLRDIPPERADEARRVLATALARGEVRHPGVMRNAQLINEVREVWRRSGGATPRLSQEELVTWYERSLAGVGSYQAFLAAPVRFDADAFVPREERQRFLALPGAVELRDRSCQLWYEVEETPAGPRGVARIVVPEKIARTLVAEELPPFDRPFRFTVTRGARGAVKADSLEELQERLDAPWSEDERGRGARETRGRQDGRGRRDDRPRGGGGRDDRPRGGHGGPRDDRRGGKGGFRPGSPSGRGKRRGK
ncbi:MAG: DEAD/DEAH box helicase [Gemmatimonadaceae bacterium]|nr:DEAD/DEAH box helicase [Gemmatimonadaceae bacterium]